MFCLGDLDHERVDVVDRVVSASASSCVRSSASSTETSSVTSATWCGPVIPGVLARVTTYVRQWAAQQAESTPERATTIQAAKRGPFDRGRRRAARLRHAVDDLGGVDLARYIGGDPAQAAALLHARDEVAQVGERHGLFRVGLKPHGRRHSLHRGVDQAEAARSGRSSHSRMRDHSTGFVNTTSAPAWRARLR
jgi:hypothetical protein